MYTTSFVVIDPMKRRFAVCEATDLKHALYLAGLKAGKVDFGILARPHLHYVVYEFGLFIHPTEQFYFAIGSTLIGGSCVVYQVDLAGNTVNYESSNNKYIQPRWMNGVSEIEREIELGRIIRPRITVNGSVTWEWNVTKENAL